MKNKLILLGLFSATLVACKKEKTVWNTDWKAPLINDTLSLKNLVNDSTLTVQSGNYFLDLTRTIKSFNLLDEVKIPDTTVTNDFTIAFPYLNVTPGLNFISDAEEQSFDLPNDVELKEVILKQGFIDFTVKNPAETKAFFTVTLPGAQKNGVVLQNVYEVPAAQGGTKGEFTGTVDMAGYSIDMTGASGHERNRFLTKIDVQSDPNGPTVSITNADVVNVVATFRDVKLSYAKGHFGSVSIADTINVDADVFKKIENGFIDFPMSEVSVEIENGIKVAAHAQLNLISNESNNGSIVNLSHPQMGNNLLINPATGSWNSLLPSQTSLTFDGSNSNIEDFLENLGIKYTVGYNVSLNPWGNLSSGTEEVFPNSRLKLKLKAKMPLSVGLHDLVFQDTFDLDFQQDFNKTHITKGDLIFELTNAFPINAGLELKFLDVNGNELTTVTPSGTVESSVLGSIDASSGLMTRESKIVIHLTESQVKALNNTKSLLLRAFANTNDTGGTPQQSPIPEGAFLKVIMKGNLQTENRF